MRGLDANLNLGFSPGYAQSKKAKKLLNDYNRGNYKWMKDKDKEMVASIAAQYGLDFKAPSKPLQKALFDFADMATFGLLPDEWRPTTIGEEYGFESGLDKVAGGIGSLGGLLTPWGGPGLLMRGAGKGARAAKAWWKGGKGGAGSGGAVSGPISTGAGNKMAQLNPGRDVAQLGQGVPQIRHGGRHVIDTRQHIGYDQATYNRMFPKERPNLLQLPQTTPRVPVINRGKWYPNKPSGYHPPDIDDLGTYASMNRTQGTNLYPSYISEMNRRW